MRSKSRSYNTKRRKISKTEFEKNVLTPSPLLDNKKHFHDIEDIYSFIPENYKGRFSKEFREIKEDDDIENAPFWLDVGEYNSVLNSAMDFLINKKYKSIGAILSKYFLKVYPNRGNPYIGVKNIDTLEQIEFPIAIDYWRELMINKKVKLIFIKTSVMNRDDITENIYHANWIIIDKVRKVVEFVDPHGFYNVEDIKNNKWILDLPSNFQNRFVYTNSREDTDFCFIPRDYQIYRYTESCPKIGFQTLESLGVPHFLDIKGYCHLWTLFLLDLRLGNPQLTTRDVQVKMILGLKDKHENKSWIPKFLRPTFRKLFGTNDETAWRKEVGILFKEFIRDYGLYWYDMFGKK